MDKNILFIDSKVVNDTLAEVIQRVQRSLVQIHNGKRGSGAGVIWRGSGLILTNNHVVSGRGGLQVVFPGGESLPARLIGARPEHDLALLQVDADGLPAALIADSRSLRVGQLVMAVGHPWGKRNYVTMGIISALTSAVTENGSGSVQVIRSDVPLAPGNSGGPLVNSVGGVVGINTMIVGGDQGVAIPSHVASSFVSETLQRSGLAQPLEEVII